MIPLVQKRFTICFCYAHEPVLESLVEVGASFVPSSHLHDTVARAVFRPTATEEASSDKALRAVFDVEDGRCNAADQNVKDTTSLVKSCHHQATNGEPEDTIE